jgi:hypothetical protein
LEAPVRWAKSKNPAAETRSSNDGLVAEVNEVIRVRDICLTAKLAAEITAADPENTEACRAYQNAKEQCLAVADGISDGFYKDTARHYIYTLCQRANDVHAAKLIFEQIGTYEIRGNILDGRPALFD